MNKNRVLIVDDLPDWRLILQQLLIDGGFEVETASSTQAALEAIKGSLFDLAVVDIRLDEVSEENVDGLNLAFEIKKINPNVKIIILTGYATTEILRKALEPNTAGERLVDDFIVKNQTDELLKIVKRLLVKHS